MSGKKAIAGTVLVLALLTAGSALAAKPPKQYTTKTTVTIGQVQTGEGAAPVIEGRITSPKAICEKGRSVIPVFTPSNGESVITAGGATSKSDGSWSSALTARDAGKSGTLEVKVFPKKVGSVICKEKVVKVSESL